MDGRELRLHAIRKSIDSQSKWSPPVEMQAAAKKAKLTIHSEAVVPEFRADPNVAAHTPEWGWDTHGSNAEESLKDGFVKKCNDIDKAIGALLSDLEMRGVLEDTLVVWGGKFGRTPCRKTAAAA